jgi:hypothetical protein
VTCRARQVGCLASWSARNWTQCRQTSEQAERLDAVELPRYARGHRGRLPMSRPSPKSSPPASQSAPAAKQFTGLPKGHHRITTYGTDRATQRATHSGIATDQRHKHELYAERLTVNRRMGTIAAAARSDSNIASHLTLPTSRQPITAGDVRFFVVQGACGLPGNEQSGTKIGKL